MRKKSTTVKRCNPLVLHIIFSFVRLFFIIRGIRVHMNYKCDKKLKGPCVVLCNHGSFIDFYFAGKMLIKSDFNFVVARLYFFHKWLGWALRTLGCFPKSMFTKDLESVKNCIRVLNEGRVLVMMPEARLSTVGKFEDIQESTYSFLKKVGVPVYTIRLQGDYFADPKWGNGFRRGALVEAELELLFENQQTREMSVEDIAKAVEERLYYDEFEWLKTRPRLRYFSPKLAEGLENILTLCPSCGRHYTIVTKGRQVSCEYCGPLTKMNTRYGFKWKFQFDNFAQWYDWQKEQMLRRIEEDPDFCLQSKVELRHGDKSGRNMTRHAGEGICVLDRTGLTYTGTRDGEECNVHFPIKQIYRLLFGAGVNFEVYQGNEIFFFVPEEKRSCVDWYIASMLLHDRE